MKDALGHGSNDRGGVKPSAKGMRLIKTHVLGPHSAKVYNNPEWGEKVVQTFRNGVYQSKNDYHTDDLADAHATAQSQLKRWDDQDAAASKTSYSPDSSGAHNSPLISNAAAAASLASGPKSIPVSTHDSMQSASRAFSDKNNEKWGSYANVGNAKANDAVFGSGRHKLT